MQFYSTNNKKLGVSFQDAVFNSLPEDKGLYMPVSIPRLDNQFLDNIQDLTLNEIAFEVAYALLKEDIEEEHLRRIIDDAIDFDAPLVSLNENTGVLELFHGPSLAFKDFGARFMSRVMGYFLREGEKELDVLVATSGDTGGAVALGFLGVPNTRVTILYPKDKVSPVQELQLCTNGQNIHAVEIDGNFDDCQSIVKQAFNDPVLRAKFRLTSANSINISRLIPQTFYYFYAYAQVRKLGYSDVVFSVPSGNFGNLAAGIVASKMGLPVRKFLAATNANDTVPLFLSTGSYQPKPSVTTWSNAMDVGDPSNWVRIEDMLSNDAGLIRSAMEGCSFSDDETLSAIREVYDQHGYIMCPHTAIAWLALRSWQAAHPDPKEFGVLLSTAHPCKFPEVFPETIRNAVEIPAQVRELEGRAKIAANLGSDFEGFKKYMLERAVSN